MISKAQQPLSLSAQLHVASPPALRFSPTAWAKLVYLRDYTDGPLAAMAVTSEADLLYVSELHFLRQAHSGSAVRFDDAALADFYHQQIARELVPDQFARISVHTRKDNNPLPTQLDERLFKTLFAHAPWAVMAIVDRTGGAFARLDFQVGPGGSLVLPVGVDYGRPFAATDRARWVREYEQCVGGTG